ncbi:MAG: REP-associated tyrosine transposase [Bacillota bacterium]
MPRKPRRLSNSRIYHVMIRGNEKKDIFFKDKDKNKLIRILKRINSEDGHYLYAYCIMNNHAHFVIKEGNENISKIMKRINTSYATYYNKKYSRVGHVFQDRFKSEPVEDERYLLEVIRYVHNNPVKAGMVSEPENFPWSSYSLYLRSDENDCDFLSMDTILDIYGENQNRAIIKFIEFTKKRQEKEFLDVHEDNNTTEEIHIIVNEYLSRNKIGRDTLSSDKEIRDNLLGKLKAEYGFSVRSIEKETGINRNIVQRFSANNESKRTVPSTQKEE